MLKLCLSARWDAQALPAARNLAAQQGLDWGLLLQAARRAGVAPLLYHATRQRGLLPTAAEAALRQAYYHNAARNLILLHRLETVLHQLAAAGVPVIVLKGAALATTLYASAALRPMGDLDLLVHPEHVPTALAALAQLGYAPGQGDLPDSHSAAYNNQVALAKAGDGQAPVEIHWSLFSPTYYYRRVPMPWFWETARPAQFGAASAWVLGPEALLLHLCAHILQHGGCERVRWLSLHDVAEVLAYYREQLDWERLLHKAQEYGLLLPVRQALQRVHADWGAPVPTQALERLRALRPSRREERVFRQLTTAQRPVQHLWAGLAGIPDWRSRWALWRSIALPPPAYMRQRYAIRHRALLPLYYPYRWLRSLRRT